MKWQVQLGGNPADLKWLSKEFDEGPFMVVEQDGTFYLEASEFETMQHAGPVRKRASDIVTNLSGAAQLAGASAPVVLGTVDRVRSDGGRDINVVVRERTTPGDRASIGRGILPKWVELALANPSVGKALRLRNEGPLSWSDLYRLWEVVEDCLGGSVSELDGISANQRTRFKRTANSVAAAGDAARHGRETTQPPPNPMGLPEAREFIDLVVREWLKDLS